MIIHCKENDRNHKQEHVAVPPYVTTPLATVKESLKNKTFNFTYDYANNPENLVTSDLYRLYFHRPPFFDPESPLLSALSQGRYPIPASLIGEEKLLSAKDCSSCHKIISHQWETSLHKMAYTNIRFQDAWKREPVAWCLNCHAPFWKERDPLYQESDDFESKKYVSPEVFVGTHKAFIVHNKNPTMLYRKTYTEKEIINPFAEEGVNCAVCHVRNGKIYTGKNPSQLLRIRALLLGRHGLEVDSTLSSPDLCAGCHEFTFPSSYDPVVGYHSQPMQGTVSQFYSVTKEMIKQDAQPVRSCVFCHFGENQHGSSHLTDPEKFSGLFEISFQFVNANASSFGNIEKSNANHKTLLIVKIKMPRIGHHLPTGDLFRQIRIRAYHKNGKELLHYTIARSVDNNTFLVEYDTALKPESEQSLHKEFQFPLLEEPFLCKVSYHFEGKIEHILSKEIPQSQKEISLYEGSCH